MRRLLPAALLALVIAAPSPLRAQVAITAPSAPEVGDVAPDFTAALVGTRREEAAPVTLSALRGKVVVLAFYPKDRTSGCTAEMTKFRDEHATLFGGDVVVLPISADSVASHVSWNAEMKFPFGLVSDPSLALAERYGSRTAGRPFANRTVFVIGRDGRIVWRDLKFSALSEDAYSQLAAAVARAKGARSM
jgi:peroxiredoxin Q/BCP